MGEVCQFLPIAAILTSSTPIAVAVSYSNLGLSALPSGIPTDIETLDVSENGIAEINSDDLEELDALIELNLGYNKLVEFPYLVSVAETLRFLCLRNNKIKNIPSSHLLILTHLEKLSVVKNKITVFPSIGEFPTLPSPLVALKTAGYGTNNITQIDIGNFQKIASGNLSYIGLGKSEIAHFHMPCDFAEGMRIYLGNVSHVTCNKQMAWMLTNRVNVTGLCDQPEQLKGRSIHSLTYRDIDIYAGKERIIFKNLIYQNPNFR